MRFRDYLRPAAFVIALTAFDARAQSDEEYDPFSDEAQRELAEEDLFDRDESQEYLEPGKVKELTNLAKPSLVTVRQLGRDGASRGTGSGFIISEDGLIVSNLHVIGEGRSIEVELSDGSILPVVEIHAFDRYYDLAVLRVDLEDRALVPLKVADSSLAEQGDLIVGFGSPQGLKFSVVAGVLSAIRELDAGFLGDNDTPTYPMLQLAMPIELGNSGGPVLNLDGEVIGVVTLRHRVTDNLGFAVQSNDLQALLDKPNPIPIGRWRTIGVIDPRLWTTIMGADWTQRGGVISAKKRGDGFGGRALCLSEEKVPKLPYEVSVSVRLDDEGGAAGLAFAADGEDKHYGFYPTGGKIRLTRFDGPDVYSWSILKEFDTPSYEYGEWNEIRVRVEEEMITGWVNGTKVMEFKDDGLRGGQVGLCKFRDTEAEFRGFDIGKNLGAVVMAPEERKRLEKTIEQFIEGENAEVTIGRLSVKGQNGRSLLLEKAEELTMMAERLKRLETEVHRQIVIEALKEAIDQPEGEVDLFEVGLQIARIDDPELDLDHYRSAMDRLVADADDYLTEHALEGDSKEQAIALRDFMFRENGFHGSRTEYYHHSNSYLSHVLDDREGLPITLSVVFVELARRLEIQGVFGAPLPGKFMVGVEHGAPDARKTVYIDVFENGRTMSRGKVTREIWAMIGGPPRKESFEAATPREIAVRMLRNLVDIEINQRRTPTGARDYLELLLAIEPDAAQERFQRALLKIQGEDMEGARGDLDWLLENRPPGLDYSRLEAFRDTLPEEGE